MYPAELVYSRLAASNIPNVYQTLIYKLYMLNPMNIIADAYRKTLLPSTELNLRGTHIPSQPLDYGMLAIAAIVCVAVAIGGYAFFNSRKWVFAERI